MSCDVLNAAFTLIYTYLNTEYYIGFKKSRPEDGQVYTYNTQNLAESMCQFIDKFIDNEIKQHLNQILSCFTDSVVTIYNISNVMTISNVTANCILKV